MTRTLERVYSGGFKSVVKREASFTRGFFNKKGNMKKEEIVEEIAPVEEIEEVAEEVKEKKSKKTKDGLVHFYKGYDINWLAKEEQEDHPDRYLVEEFNKKG
jgi:ABC-type glycerol-3-phosphate transport system substrate-binding protein